RGSEITDGSPSRIPRIVRCEEDESGVTWWSTRPDGVAGHGNRPMPNMAHFGSSGHAGTGEGLHWIIPVDDEHHMNFFIYCAHQTGEVWPRDAERRAVRADREGPRIIQEMGEAV